MDKDLKKAMNLLKQEIKYTKTSESDSLTGIIARFEELEVVVKKYYIHSVVVPKGTLPKCEHDWLKSVIYKNAKCCRKCRQIL